MFGLANLLGMLFLLQSEHIQSELTNLYKDISQVIDIPTERMLGSGDEEEVIQRFLAFGSIIYTNLFLMNFPHLVRAIKRLSQSAADSPGNKHLLDSGEGVQKST